MQFHPPQGRSPPEGTGWGLGAAKPRRTGRRNRSESWEAGRALCLDQEALKALSLRELPETPPPQDSPSLYLLVEPQRASPPASSCSFQTRATDAASSQRANGDKGRGSGLVAHSHPTDCAPGDRDMKSQWGPGSPLDTPQGLVKVVPQVQAFSHGGSFLSAGKPPPAS